MIKLPEPVAWRAQYPTSNKWHYKDHGPIEYSLKQLTWEALVPESQLKQAVRDAYEEAAKTCVAAIKKYGLHSNNTCAHEIRALIKEIEQ